MNRDIIYSYDPTDLCELKADDHEKIHKYVELAKYTRYSIEDIRYFAEKTFSIIVNDPKLFLTSTKDYNTLKTTEKESRMGIHTLRAYFAELIDINRQFSKTPYGIEVNETGVTQINDFLDSNRLESIRQEIETFPILVSKDGSNIISNLDKDKYQNLYYVLNDSGMRELIFDCLRYPIDHQECNLLYKNNTFVQRILNKPDDHDIQKVIHSDTFFPCLKWWYFPYEVTLKSGPFAYVPYSHILTLDRLKFIHDQSVKIARNEIDEIRTYSHVEGSLRIFENELKNMGLIEKKYVVPSNTLVVANLVGFHRRSHVDDNAIRSSIHGSIRPSRPFN